MVDLKKFSTNPTFCQKILLYGDSGCGKTTLIGTAQDVPEMANVLVCDADGGGKTLEGRGDIVGASTRTAKDVEEVAWLLVQRKPEVASIKTLVIDGCTELQQKDLADLAAFAAKDPRNAKREESGKAPRDADTLEVQDWMKNKSRMLRLLRMCRDLEGINVIFTAWAKMVFPKKPNGQQDKTKSPDVVAPDFAMDAVATAIRGACDAVWYLYVDKAGNRQLVTNEYGYVKAKTRGDAYAAKLGTTVDGKFIPAITNPTFPQIVALYKESIAATTK